MVLYQDADTLPLPVFQVYDPLNRAEIKYSAIPLTELQLLLLIFSSCYGNLVL